MQHYGGGGGGGCQEQQRQGAAGVQLFRDPYYATETQFNVFVRGLNAVLNQWTALNLVAQHCDVSALQSMYQELVAWFESKGEVYSDELELFFEDFFDETRSVIIEDDSMKEVADVLHEMYCRCCTNDFSMVEQYVSSLEIYRQMNPVALSIDGGGDWDVDAVNYDAAVVCEEQACENVQLTGSKNINRDGAIEETGNDTFILDAQQKRQKKKNKKNTYARDADGWCVVQR